MTHHLKTRIVLANGGHAKWIERHGADFVVLHEVEAGNEAANHAADTGPRAGGTGNRAEPHSSQFGSQIALSLNRQSAAGEFERLAIAAPPHVLRAIRDNLLPGVRAKLVHELSKDLTRTPPRELGAWLDSPLVG